jgi:hypothetical protein
VIPASFIPYFSISAGAVASLIGLLFVAVSVAPGRTVGKGAPIARRAVAESSFTALLNAFLVALIALIPTAPLALGVLAVTGATLVGSVRSLILMTAHQRQKAVSWINVLRQLILPLGMLLIYSLEFWWGVTEYRTIRLSADSCGALANILLVLAGLAIVRAWELIGAQRSSFFALLGALPPPEDDEPGGGVTARP